MLLTSAVGAALAARAPEPLRGVARVAAAVGALAAATELFSWMVRHPEHPVARALARPGHELQAPASRPPIPTRRSSRWPRPRSPRASSSSDAMALNTRQQGRRLPPEIFDLPVEKMREGYYTDAYFNHTRSALLADGRHPRVVMQVFQKHHAVLGGMDEAIAILKLCSDDWDALTVHALYDGDRIEPWETVMTIEGDYTLFAHLETVYLGVLARRTLISTNVDERARRRRRQADHLHAGPARPPPRADGRRVRGVRRRARSSAPRSASPPTRSRPGGAAAGIGTVPHALIAAYGGNTVLAATKFAEWAPPDFNIVVLVDFENDSVRTALEVARALKDKLWGVRLDTSGQLVDRSLWNEMGDFDPRGVNERLVRKVRDALDRDGFERVKIVASGGFTRRPDPRVRAGGRPGRRLRRRLVADPRRERLHRRHRPHRRPRVGQGRPALPPEPAPRARLLERSFVRASRATGRSSSVERTTLTPRAAKRGDGRVCLLGEVDGAGDDDRRGAVLEQVDALGGDVVEQVVDRPGDAVALRLAGDRRSRRSRAGSAISASFRRSPTSGPSAE